MRVYGVKPCQISLTFPVVLPLRLIAFAEAAGDAAWNVWILTESFATKSLERNLETLF
jgi:hypothetical protein